MRRLKKKLLVAVLTCAVMVISLVGCGKGEGRMAEGVNPVIDQEGADPSILKQGDLYYYTKTTGNNVTLYCSPSFTDVAAAESRILYEPGSELQDLWAPEIQYLNDSWYIYFAARIPGEEMHHMYVLKNESEDPLAGEWSCERLKGMDDKFAIDGVVLDTGDKNYFIWSGWEGYENVQQNLYLAEMISPTEVKEEKILLSRPEYNWEKQGEPLVNEGPEVLIHGNTINLVYSASGSWTDDYCLGLLTADVRADIHDPAVWVKEKTPIMASGNGVYGPGHNGFTVSPDGTQSILIYHAARWQGAGWNRQVRFGYLKFDEMGKIMPMTPAASDGLLELPAGEQKREVYLTDVFTCKGDVELQPREGILSKSAAVWFQGSEDEISLTIESKEKREADLFFYGKIEDYTDENDRAEIVIQVNDTEYEAQVYPGEYYQPIAVKVQLEKGRNEVSLRSIFGGEFLSIDRVEVSQ